MSIGKTTAIAKAVGAVTWATESTLRLAGKAGRGIVGIIKDKKFYDIDIVVEGVVTKEHKKVSTEEISKMLEALEYFPNSQLIIKKGVDKK